MNSTENKTSEIIIFPEFEELKQEVERLRTELSMVVLERDQLRYVECENIEMRYMLELGALEYKAYEAQCRALRLKRKIELIRAKLNRQEKVDLSRIERILEREMEEYTEKLDKKIEQMNQALRRNECPELSVQESKELKKLYRKVVKVLHPDLNPQISDAQRVLFHNAVQAYKNGDVEALRIINEMVGEDMIPDDSTDAMAELLKEKQRLEKMLASVLESIEEMKGQYPYTLKEILEDSGKIEEHRSKLQEIMECYLAQIEAYNKTLKELM